MAGHDQFHFIATYCGRHSKRNACITARCFNDGISRLNLAAHLGFANHVHGRSIFHRAGRIVAL